MITSQLITTLMSQLLLFMRLSELHGVFTTNVEVCTAFHSQFMARLLSRHFAAL